MQKLYSLKRATAGLMTSVILLLMAVLLAQPAAAQPDSLRPKIHFFTPTSASQGTLVDIVGENFLGTAGVGFGGTPAASVQVLSDSLIRAKVGTGSSGFVSVFTAFGTDSLGGFTFIRDTLPPDTSRPDVRSFTPTSGRTGTVVDIRGLHFRNTIAVSFGGVRASSFFVLSDTLVRAIVGNGATGAVRVTTIRGTDSLGGFTYIRDTARPVVRSFTPTRGRTGTAVTIRGLNFRNTIAVSFGGVKTPYYAVYADTMIIALVGNGATGAVRVTTINGTDSLGGFTYISDSSRPLIEFFYPTSARRGTEVTIVGSRFTNTTAVSFGGVPAASFTVGADSLIYAIVGNGATGAVKVVTPFGLDSMFGFTYIRDTVPPDTLPDITRFTPASGKTGTNVFIFGKNLKRTTSVRFGSVPAASFTVLSDSLVRATVGNGASGFVKVFTPAGADSLCCFTYIKDTLPPDSLRPDIIKFSPERGTTGTKVFIVGKHFTGTTAVSFGGVPAASFTVLSDSAISAIVDTGRTGLVKVVTPFGFDTLGTFVYRPPIIVHYAITVSPNPASGFAIVTHPGVTGYAQLKLSDVAGNVVRSVKVSPNVSQTRLNLSGVQPGVYKLSWSNGARWYSRTLLVN